MIVLFCNIDLHILAIPLQQNNRAFFIAAEDM